MEHFEYGPARMGKAERSIKQIARGNPGSIKGKKMADKEWAEKALLDFQKSELEEMERVRKAYEALEAAKKELSDAKESLKGTRGCIVEMTWQLKHYDEHGRLP